MSILEQIKRHRSIRRFGANDVSDEQLSEILECATRASTGGSMQLYSIIVTRNGDRRETLSGLHFGTESIRSAPVVLTFCVDCRRLGRWLALRGETLGVQGRWGFTMGFSDALLAAQNALLAAEGLGLGGCFLGSTLAAAPALTRFFGCPELVMPVVTLVIGHPSEDPVTSTRLPLNSVVHEEQYADASEEDLRTAHANHAEVTFDRFCEAPYVRTAVEAAGIGDLAGYYSRLMYPAELIETAGAYFDACLQVQGFADDDRAARTRALRRSLSNAAFAGIHPLRQFAFAMALASGELDAMLDGDPCALETDLATYIAGRDPSLYEEMTRRGPLDLGIRARLLDCVSEFSGRTGARAAE